MPRESLLLTRWLRQPKRTRRPLMMQSSASCRSKTGRDGWVRGYSTIYGFFKLVIMRRLIGMPENERVFLRESLSTVSPAKDALSRNPLLGASPQVIFCIAFHGRITDMKPTMRTPGRSIGCTFQDPEW